MKYTVKQIADRAGVSKTTVKRHLKRIEEAKGAEYIQQNVQTEPNGVILISEELEKQLHDDITRPERTATQDCNVPQRTGTDCNATPERAATCTGTYRNAPEHVPERTATNTETERNAPERSATAETIAALNRLIETQQAQIEQLSGIIEHLKEQITVKDNQLTAKDSQIEQLSILTSQAQALNLKALETVPEQNEAGAEEPEREKFILFRMFRKKKGNDK